MMPGTMRQFLETANVSEHGKGDCHQHPVISGLTLAGFQIDRIITLGIKLKRTRSLIGWRDITLPSMALGSTWLI